MVESSGSHRAYAAAFLVIGLALAAGAFFLLTRVNLVAGVVAGVVALAFVLAGLGGLRLRGSRAP